jgi:hypothetical protein
MTYNRDMKTIILLVMFFSFSTFAEELQKVKVHTFDNFDMRLGDQYDSEKVKPLPQSSELLPPEAIQALIQKANLQNEVKSFDQLGLDLLLHYAKTYDFEKLQKKYPSINPKKLKKLKEMVSK